MWKYCVLNNQEDDIFVPLNKYIYSLFDHTTSSYRSLLLIIVACCQLSEEDVVVL